MTTPPEDDPAEVAEFWRLTQEALAKQRSRRAVRYDHLDGHEEPDMSERTVSIAEAKAHLSELIAAGEQVVVTKRGVPVATILPSPKPKKKLDLAWLEEATKDIPYQHEDSETLLRRMRDDYRY